MRTKLPLIVLVLIPWVNISDAKADDDYQVPRTEWGLPDLQGVWNFNSSTPMQRPERFGTQEFLTPEEVKQDRIREAERRHALDAVEAELVVDPQAPPVGDDPGGYNTFWYENASIGENVRTSLIIYPENGQLPARIEGSA